MVPLSLVSKLVFVEPNYLSFPAINCGVHLENRPKKWPKKIDRKGLNLCWYSIAWSLAGTTSSYSYGYGYVLVLLLVLTLAPCDVPYVCLHRLRLRGLNRICTWCTNPERTITQQLKMENHSEIFPSLRPTLTRQTVTLYNYIDRSEIRAKNSICTKRQIKQTLGPGSS